MNGSCSCVSQLGQCTTNAECCGLYCDNGTCQGTQLGAFCNGSNDCPYCTNGVCACYATGVFCTAATQCCSGVCGGTNACT